MKNETTFKVEELMMVEIARHIKDGERVAVGTLSPIPAAAVLLAEKTTAPNLEAFIWFLPGYWPFTEGVTEFFDMGQRGDIDLFFLGGAQIDKEANTNLNSIGSWEKPKVRLPGGAGTGTLYFTVPRVILFSERHDQRSFVEKVDFITGKGVSGPEVFRRGGPAVCITNLAVLSFNAEKKGWKLASLHPGVTLEKVRENTGFSFLEENTAITPLPSEEELSILRQEIKPKLAQAYPHFAKRTWGE